MPFDEITALYLIVAFLLGLLLKSYLPNYVKKKAENLATKEDIKNITEKIESVKSQIDINTDAHKSYISERKAALLNFYDEISSFNYELRVVNFGDFPMDGGQSLYDYQANYRNAVAEILKSYQRLVIYLPNDSTLLEQAAVLSRQVIEFRVVLKDNFGSIKKASIREQQAHANIQINGESPYIIAAHNADKINKDYWLLMKPLNKKYNESYHSYISSLNSFLKESEINCK
ncbi:hypothetical protein [Vibrio comitans]|uniref:Uncharacterized protein n=1 Tax=Vibrio comitans NBRC 102076 TaxID=1219078 RepID=A0A4Y3IM67_9VIBR|nr:hypothetical protein [Vibrio comitans]GEA60377.1 hypothetical protein VCO01S_15700 [Vibrio comitans NBRC 102076]